MNWRSEGGQERQEVVLRMMGRTRREARRRRRKREERESYATRNRARPGVPRYIIKKKPLLPPFLFVYG